MGLYDLEFFAREAIGSDYDAFRDLIPELGATVHVPTREQFFALVARGAFFIVHAGSPQGYGFLRTYGETAHLVHVIVAPGSRRKGLGRAVMREAARRAHRAGCVRWYLNVSKDYSWRESFERRVADALVPHDEPSSRPDEVTSRRHMPSWARPCTRRRAPMRLRRATPQLDTHAMYLHPAPMSLMDTRIEPCSCTHGPPWVAFRALIPSPRTIMAVPTMLPRVPPSLVGATMNPHGFAHEPSWIHPWSLMKPEKATKARRASLMGAGKRAQWVPSELHRRARPTSFVRHAPSMVPDLGRKTAGHGSRALALGVCPASTHDDRRPPDSREAL
jgi:GNAT superfamily N-acetyltransferase